jgi:hypothetical protein
MTTKSPSESVGRTALAESDLSLRDSNDWNDPGVRSGGSYSHDERSWSGTEAYELKSLLRAIGSLLREGLAMPVYNDTGGELAAGTLVRITGYSAANSAFTVTKADADTNMATHVVRDAIANTGTGLIYAHSHVTSIDTSGATAVGDAVYLSQTAGAFTFSSPSSPALAQEVGRVTAKDATSGAINFVLPGNVPSGAVDSVFGRTGAVVAAASDYDADQVDVTPAGNIAATDVQAALEELDTEKAATGHNHDASYADIDGDVLDVDFTPANYTPDASPAEASDVDDLAAHLKGVDTAIGNKADSGHNHDADYAAIDGDVLDVDFTPANYTPDASPAEASDVDDLAAHLKGIDTAIGNAGDVDSVFGRTGAVVATASDYDANQIDFTPAGDLAATDVQAALEELDTEKAATGHNHDASYADIDGDVLDVDFTPANYAPDDSPAEAADVDDLAAHLKGIDTALASAGAVDSVFGRTGAVVAASGDYGSDEITNDSDVGGSTVSNALNTLKTALPTSISATLSSSGTWVTVGTVTATEGNLYVVQVELWFDAGNGDEMCGKIVGLFKYRTGGSLTQVDSTDTIWKSQGSAGNGLQFAISGNDIQIQAQRASGSSSCTCYGKIDSETIVET